MNIINKIDKILNYKTYSDKQKIDSLLEIDANLYCNLGKETNKTERLEVKRYSKLIYKAIKSINADTGNLFLQHMDQ